jgi:hypothetical protein
VYAYMLVTTGAPRWRQYLVGSAGDWLRGELAAATVRLDSASLALPPGPASDAGCADVRRTLPVVEALNPGLATRLTDPVGSGGAACRPENKPN